MHPFAYRDVPISALHAEQTEQFKLRMEHIGRSRIPGLPCHYIRPLPERRSEELPERNFEPLGPAPREDGWTRAEDRIVIEAKSRLVNARYKKIQDILAWNGYHRSLRAIKSRWEKHLKGAKT